MYESLKPHAMKLGSAFQKVNFLRDLEFDNIQLGRTYFPDLDLNNMTNVEVGNAGTNKSLANDSQTAKVDISELSIGFFTRALENIATLRATNAAGMARLQLAEDHARLTKANLEAANSRIMDVDVAEESTRFAKYNILTQASAAMLSQANQASSTALLLQLS